MDSPGLLESDDSREGLWWAKTSRNNAGGRTSSQCGVPATAQHQSPLGSFPLPWLRCHASSPLWSRSLRSVNLDGFPGRRHGQLADPRSGSSATALRGQSLRITDTLHRIYATKTRVRKDLFLSREASPCWASSRLLPPGKLEMSDAVHGPRLFMLSTAVRPPYQLVSRS